MKTLKLSFILLVFLFSCSKEVRVKKRALRKIEQAKRFTEAADVTAIALTKLDGTAKGGIVLAISDLFKIPIKYIGVGEGMEHLQIFNKKAFVDSLFS